MSQTISAIPDKTLEVLARTFCREADSYGFGSVDYLRYINCLMEEFGETPDAGTLLKTSSAEGEVKPVVDALPARTERVVVREFVLENDRDLFARWLEDEYGRYFLLSRISGQRSDLEVLLSNSDHRFGVIELPCGKPIGALAYLNHDKQRHKAELRKMIGESAYRATGLAREATEIWISYGLNTLELHKIYVNTLHTHIRNIKLNESLGFKVEGLLHNEALIDGEYHDVLRMGLCAE